MEPALRDSIRLITSLVACLEATAQPLSPLQSPVSRGWVPASTEAGAMDQILDHMLWRWGALSAIQRMEFVDHQIAECAAGIWEAAVMPPQALEHGAGSTGRRREQVVELLVVAEQDVGRGLVQGRHLGTHAAAGQRGHGRLII
ncbi:MAG: hypothetical protein ACK46L_09460 [Synechococcaceae cyanobacterium]